MENAGKFMTIFNILRPLGISCGSLVIIVCSHLVFFPFWDVWTNPGNPDVDPLRGEVNVGKQTNVTRQFWHKVNLLCILYCTS
jgi:hypothetical protein